MGIVIFARMSSSRLPGKMLLPFGAETLLGRIIRRARLLGFPIVVATSDDVDDDQIATEACTAGTRVYRGRRDDVLHRALAAAEAAGFDAFARLCGDRPFFPLDDMQRALDSMRLHPGGKLAPDLVTTHAPNPCPAGLTTEVVTTAALRRAMVDARRPDHREHVTTLLYERPDAFERVELETNVHSLQGERFAVDTESDYRRLSAVVDADPDIALAPQRAFEILKKMPPRGAA